MKVSQITGEMDRELQKPTQNQTETRFGLYGTDLGASFEHEGKLVFLFGDTWPVGAANTPDRPVDGDAIAFSTDRDPEDGLKLDFVAADDGKYLAVQIPGVSLKGFEVPNGGFSHGGWMHGFYTTDASFAPDDFQMKRSVLARSRDGKKWELVRTVSTDRFINVAPWVVDAAKVPGLPMKGGKGMLMWASGTRYRRSDVSLAFTPLNKLDDASATRYWGGSEKGWVEKESDAAPLLDLKEVGEVSVAWCDPLRKWIMTSNAATPRGIHVRQADQPWGPWSNPAILFNPDDGYGKFMHISHEVRKADEVHDPWRPNDWGGEYGPYLIPRFFKKEAEGTRIYFLMSTWNPYNVVLMRATIR